MPGKFCLTLLLVTLLAACPNGGSASSSPELRPARRAVPDGPMLELAWDGAELSLGATQLAQSSAGAWPVPYTLASDSPQVVTALLDGLEPCSIVLQADSQSPGAFLTTLHRGYLPQALPGGGCALLSTPDALTGVSSGLVILDAAGAELWHVNDGSQAQLLLPALDHSRGPGAAQAPLLVLRWQGGDLIYPYGSAPELLLLTQAGADTVETALALDLPGPAAGVELLAGDPAHGLLLVQYDYQAYEFISLDLASLAITGRWELSGQPLTQLVYPGPGYAYIGLTLDGGRAGIAVFEGSAQGVIETWSFDLAGGALDKGAYLGEIPHATDAENQADSFPGAVPWPQQILPSAGGSEWRIPAILDSAEQALVVYSNGTAEWIAGEQ